MGVRKRERPRRQISMQTEETRRSRAREALKELNQKQIVERWMKLDDDDAIETSDLVPDWAWEKRFGKTGGK